MPYIGHNPTNAGSFIFLDDIASSFNGSATQFNLAVGGVAITPNTQNLLIALDGVIQQAPDAYTVSGSSITFTAAIPANTDFYGILMGQSASIGQGTIGADELKVTGNGTNGQVLVSDGDGTFSWSTDAEPYLPLAGGTMTGTLAMGSNNITGTGTIGGTLTTAAQANITSVGTLSSLDVSGAITAGTSFTLDNASGSAVIRSQSSFNNTVDLTASSGGDAFIEASDTSQIKIGHASGTKLIIDTHANSGRVGIGETSPDGMLHIKKDAGTHHLIIEESSNTASRSWALSGAKGDLGYGKLGLYPGTSQGGTPGNTPTMTFLPTGEVGIGVASPSAKLHIKDTDNPASPNGSVVIEGQRDGTANLLELRARDNSSPTSALPINQGGIIRMNGFDGTDFEEMAYIGYQAEATVADGDAPSRLVFGTTSDGSGLVSEKMRITSDGKVGIGDTSPTTAKLSISHDDASDANGLFVYNPNTGSGAKINLNLGLERNASAVKHIAARLQAGKEQEWTGTPSTVDGFLAFQTVRDETLGERMRITSSGEIGFGKTTSGLSSNPGFWHYPGELSYNEFVRTSTSDSSANIYISRANHGKTLWFGLIGSSPFENGSVSINATQTAFNTTSDYRIKENEIELPNALSRVNELKPYRFNFISDADNTVDGFFAHEVAEVVPEAVTGEKDAVNDDGDIEPQQLDNSKLVPLLVKALQELSAKVEVLENA